MPILPAEPDLYPPDLWVSPALQPQVEPGDGLRWWCLHTKPRQEKTAARHLRSRGVAFYLPMAVQESRTPQGRKIRSIVPLFTGYLFLLGDPLDRLEAFQSHALVQCLEVGDQAGLDRDLRQIHRVLSSGLPVVPEPVHAVGAEVRIVGGLLDGVIGRVIRRGERDRFTAVVRFLGRGASIELEDWQVEHVRAS